MRCGLVELTAEEGEPVLTYSYTCPEPEGVPAPASLGLPWYESRSEQSEPSATCSLAPPRRSTRQASAMGRHEALAS